MIIQEQYHGVPIAADGTYESSGIGTGGFICVTAGTLSITRRNLTQPLTGVAVLTAFPVSAGTVYGLPILMNAGYTVTLAGGASGTLLTV